MCYERIDLGGNKRGFWLRLKGRENSEVTRKGELSSECVCVTGKENGGECFKQREAQVWEGCKAEQGAR